MKKTVKIDEVRRIAKAFNLSEDERYWLEDMVNDINEQRSDSPYSTSLSFIMSPNWSLTKERYDALASLLMWFGLKAQKEVGNKFNEISVWIGSFLNADPQWIKRIFRGMAYSNKRWADKVYVADRCGLNVLELKR